MNIHVQTLKRKEEEKKKTAGKESCLKLSVPESRFTIKNSNVFSLNILSFIRTNGAKKRREEKRKRRNRLDGTIFVPIAAIARMEAPSKPPRTLEGLVR